MLKSHHLLLMLLFALLLTGCAAKRPALYPNQTLQAQGSATGERAIDACLALAESHGHRGPSPGAKAAGGTAVGAAAGAAVGAAVGAVTGSAGRGAAVGAAGGGTTGLLGGLGRSREPDPIQKAFVEQCLRERGFQPIGWK